MIDTQTCTSLQRLSCYIGGKCAVRFFPKFQLSPHFFADKKFLISLLLDYLPTQISSDQPIHPFGHEKVTNVKLRNTVSSYSDTYIVKYILCKPVMLLRKTC